MTSFNISSVESGDRFLEDLDMGVIEATGELNAGVYMTGDTLFRNWGILSSLFHGVALDGDADAIVSNFEGGSIDAAASGIASTGLTRVEISNQGKIEAVLDGISLTYRTGVWRSDNSGEIRGGVTGIAIGVSEIGAQVEFSNFGLVKGDWGVTSQATLMLSNTGTIEATKGLDGIQWAVVTFGFDDIVTNSGSIIGRVDLEHGNNIFDGLLGVQEWVRTGNGTDSIFGGSKDEVLTSLDGNDVITGGRGNDTISGGGGFDTLSGEAGNDRITGGRGTDGLLGGTGRDTFIFRSGDGADYISDFVATGRNHDILDLRTIPAIKNFGDFIQNHAVQAGDDVFITGQTGDSITLQDVSLRTLDKGDVLF